MLTFLNGKSVLGVLLMLYGVASWAAPLPPQNLRCNAMGAHLRPAVDAAPKLSWTLSHTERDQKSSAFHVQVFRTPVSPMIWSGDARGFLATSAEDGFVDEVAQAKLWEGVVSELGLELVWDSGVVKTTKRSTHYPDNGGDGALLEAMGVYVWRVRWFDGTAHASGWSRVAPFYATPQFKGAVTSSASWIAGTAAGDVKGNVQPLNRNNIFRRDFVVPQGQVLAAQVLICGLGYNELRINGAKVDNTLMLGTGWTQYEARVLYLHHDVTELIGVGNNTLGVMLGDGWRNETAFNNFGINIPASDNHRQTLWLVMMVTYLDPNGNSQTFSVVSDGSWWASVGPVVADSVYDGEWYDARRWQAGWDAPGFSPSAPWSAAAVVSGPAAPVMSVQNKAVNMRVSHILYPLSLMQYNDGSWLVDFGQNMAGVCQLTLSNTTAGTAVVLQHAEILNNGNGQIYTTNLRSARATDTYITAGGAEEIYIPRFTYHGFRFVHVVGYPGTLTSDDIVALHFHSTGTQQSSLRFSYPTLFAHTDAAARAPGKGGAATSRKPRLRIQELDVEGNPTGPVGLPEHLENDGSILDMIHKSVFWGQRSNLMSVITDCDQRDERLGWMGDASLSADTMAYNFITDGSAFFANTFQNILDSQQITGTVGIVPDVVPAYRYGGYPSDPAWGAAFFSVAHALVKSFGELELIGSEWAKLDMFFNWYATLVAPPNNFGNMFSRYGDWVPPPPNPACPGAIVSGHIYIVGVMQMLEMATIIGEESWIEKYTALYASLVPGFNAAWLNNNTAMFGAGLQSENSFGLHIGALELDTNTTTKAAVIDNLLNDIVATQNTHITGGISGVKAMMHVLAGDQFLDFPRVDLALQLVETLDYPSWGYMMVNPFEPGTTIWELMNAPTGNEGMDSRNHHMFSSVDTPIWEHFGGIRQPLGSYGFQELLFHPAPVMGLSFAKTELLTVQGQVSMEWQRAGGVQCTKASEEMLTTLDCGLNGGTIASIDFASYGLPVGGCNYLGYNAACHAGNTTSVVSALCVGYATCQFTASNTLFGDPCVNQRKWLSVQYTCTGQSRLTAAIEVPVGSSAVVRLPQLALGSVTVIDQSANNAVVYSSAMGFNAGVPGINGAMYNAQYNSVDLTVASGKFTLAMGGVTGTIVCGMAKELDTVALTCPGANSTIAYVWFASFGTSPVTSCGASTTYTVGSCHAGTSTVVVERACLGQASCKIEVADAVFGDPCFNTPKHLVAAVVCTV